MRIKLVTFAPHPNFGTCLQSYALNHVLRKMGHDVEFIYNGREKKPLTIVQRLKKLLRHILPKSIIRKYKKRKYQTTINVPTKKAPVILELPNHRLLYLLSRLPGYEKLYKAYKCKNLQWKKVYKFTFEDGNFKMRRIYTHKQYDEVSTETDLFITGSDQIWNPYCGGFNPMMFVEFGSDKKRIAYSSSISQPELPELVKERMKRDLLKFSHIGVREQRSVELLNELMGRTDVRLVVDPTYLLSVEEWTAFSNMAALELPLPERYIFCYFVGGQHRDIYEQMVQDAKRFTGIEDVITLECYNRPLNYGGGRLYKDGGPYEWVYLLQHSSYVCMDSFHATVFALKFKKDFVHALKNIDSETGSQNTRMYDIIGRYGLRYKIYVSHEKMDWHQPVDYSTVTPILDAEIKESMKFLKYEIEN
ncbi:MAG: polysaccharide pyruvyl transferase family protein [Prevotella sp.]|nr:polysaccharide pyruvyl transferase family protein [Prevotella sp.]